MQTYELYGKGQQMPSMDGERADDRPGRTGLAPGQMEDTRGRTRDLLRDAALQNAVRKRADGVPTYTVAEAAALFSVSQEYLYRLIHAGGFPAIRMRIGGNQGRYVVPAKAVERMLDHADGVGHCVDTGESVGEIHARGDVAAREAAQSDVDRVGVSGARTAKHSRRNVCERPTSQLRNGAAPEVAHADLSDGSAGAAEGDAR